ncbi:UNVERIFIED_CONTAM: hypothetical protein FKN15_037309 [Acipenser sinensis]
MQQAAFPFISPQGLDQPSGCEPLRACGSRGTLCFKVDRADPWCRREPPSPH